MTIEQTLQQIAEQQKETLALLKDCQDKNTDNKDKLYDLTDLQELFHVSRRTLFKWKSEGKMNFSQIGKKLYITEAELKRFLEVNNQNSSEYGR